MDSLEAGLELGPVGRSMEGIECEFMSWSTFWTAGECDLGVPGCGMSAGAIMEVEDRGNEMLEGSSISGSESDSSSTRAWDMIEADSYQ